VDWFAQQGAPAPSATPPAGGYQWQTNPTTGYQTDPRTGQYAPGNRIMPDGSSWIIGISAATSKQLSPPGTFNPATGQPVAAPGTPAARDPAAIQTAATQSAGGYNTAPQPGVDPYAIIRQTMAGLPPTGASLDPILAALRAQGINATRATHGSSRNPQASNDAIVMPDGTYVDLIKGWDGPNPKWNSASGPSGSYDPTRRVVGPDGQLVQLSAFQQQLGLPVSVFQPGPTGSGQFGRGGMTSLASMGGAAGAEAALMSAPGFQFRIAEGQKALERSAAARGTLLTGGTLKAITRYGQDFASNEYNNRYNQLYGLSNLGLNAAQSSANLGSSYAANTGNLYQNQANAGTGLITSGANAQAAGTAGGANANAGALQGITKGFQDALTLWYLGGQRGPAPTPNAPYTGQAL